MNLASHIHIKISVNLVLTVLLFNIAILPRGEGAAAVFGFENSVYQNEGQGCQISLPAGCFVNFTKKNDPEWSIQNRMPFDYVNFKLDRSANGEDKIFELGVGIHYNPGKLTAREFADIKDVGVKKSVKQYQMSGSSEITVSGVKGVRDDFALEKDSGWTHYSRVIVPFKGKFLVILGTLGVDSYDPGCKRIFEDIISNIQIAK